MKKRILVEFEMKLCQECPHCCRDLPLKIEQTILYWCGHPKGNNKKVTIKGIPNWCPLEDGEIYKTGE